MKKILFIVLLFISIITVEAQNVGINMGATAPDYPLTVKSGFADFGIVQTDGAVGLGLKTNQSTGGWLSTLSNHNLNLQVGNSNVAKIIIKTDGKVGIGINDINAIDYQLDLMGNLRLRHNAAANQTAGLWLDGTTLPLRSFIGTINDNYMGIWGNGGIGWNFAVNVENGQIGIGTTTPTAKLDIDGNIRIRGNSPSIGSLLISNDINGNTTWLDPISFRVEGSTDGNATTIAGGTWTKLEFGGPTYNLGFGYQPVATQFVAPVTGIYHFTAQVEFQNKRTTSGIGLDGTRNGVALSLPFKLNTNGIITDVDNNDFAVSAANIESFELDLKLQVGDIIWLNVYRNTADAVIADPRKVFFTGRLITTF